MKKRENKGIRKAYATPRLKNMGNVAKITLKTGSTADGTEPGFV